MQPSTKRDRHQAIVSLVQRATVANQEDLRRKLAARGFQVTQATLSRDMRMLKLVKTPGGYQTQSGASQNHTLPRVREMLRSFGLAVRQALNQLVLTTTTGSAQPVAASIDEEAWPEVVGTIAGDNTVLIICPNQKQARLLRGRIEAYLV